MQAEALRRSPSLGFDTALARLLNPRWSPAPGQSRKANCAVFPGSSTTGPRIRSEPSEQLERRLVVDVGLQHDPPDAGVGQERGHRGGEQRLGVAGARRDRRRGRGARRGRRGGGRRTRRSRRRTGRRSARSRPASRRRARARRRGAAARRCRRRSPRPPRGPLEHPPELRARLGDPAVDQRGVGRRARRPEGESSCRSPRGDESAARPGVELVASRTLVAAPSGTAQRLCARSPRSQT